MMDDQHTRDHIKQHADAVVRGETETVAMIQYLRDTGDVKIRTRWQDQGGRPLIVHAEPAE